MLGAVCCGDCAPYDPGKKPERTSLSLLALSVFTTVLFWMGEKPYCGFKEWVGNKFGGKDDKSP